MAANEAKPSANSVSEWVYTMAEVAEELKTPANTIRHWEKELTEFISVDRDRFKNRQYRRNEIDLLKKVREFRDRSLTFEQIRERLRAMPEGITEASTSKEVAVVEAERLPVPADVLEVLTTRIRDSIRDELLQEFRTTIRDELRGEISEELRSKLEEIGESFGSKLESSSEDLRKEIGNTSEQIRNELGSKLEEISGVLTRLETHGKRKSLLSRLFGS